MNKNIVKAIIFIICALLLLWFGTYILIFTCAGNYHWLTKCINFAIVAYEYIMAFKACRLTGEILSKEYKK